MKAPLLSPLLALLHKKLHAVHIVLSLEKKCKFININTLGPAQW